VQNIGRFDYYARVRESFGLLEKRSNLGVSSRGLLPCATRGDAYLQHAYATLRRSFFEELNFFILIFLFWFQSMWKEFFEASLASFGNASCVREPFVQETQSSVSSISSADPGAMNDVENSCGIQMRCTSQAFFLSLGSWFVDSGRTKRCRQVCAKLRALACRHVPSPDRAKVVVQAQGDALGGPPRALSAASRREVWKNACVIRPRRALSSVHHAVSRCASLCLSVPRRSSRNAFGFQARRMSRGMQIEVCSALAVEVHSHGQVQGTAQMQ
jgi:hypothetical protein